MNEKEIDKPKYEPPRVLALNGLDQIVGPTSCHDGPTAAGNCNVGDAAQGSCHGGARVLYPSCALGSNPQQGSECGYGGWGTAACNPGGTARSDCVPGWGPFNPG